MPKARPLAALALLVSVLAPSGALAQEEPAAVAEEATPDGEQEALARQVFETGRRYFERADYERAVEAFREAYRLSGRAALLVNVARSLEALGRGAEAIEALERAMTEDEELRTLAEPRIHRLRAQLERDRETRAEGPGGEAADTGDAPPAERPPASSSGGPGPLLWVGIAADGAGVILFAVSIATGFASNEIYGDLERSCPDGVCPPERQDDIDRGRTLAVASTVTLAIGGAVATAGLVMLLVELLSGSDAEEAPPRVVELTAGPGEVGAGLRARF